MNNEAQMYGEAIEVLMSDLSKSLLVREIAKHEPAVLVAAARRLGFGASLEALVREMLPDNYINAIKMVREKRNIGLVEAKNFVDNIRDEVRAA